MRKAMLAVAGLLFALVLLVGFGACSRGRLPA